MDCQIAELISAINPYPSNDAQNIVKTSPQTKIASDPIRRKNPGPGITRVGSFIFGVARVSAFIFNSVVQSEQPRLQGQAGLPTPPGCGSAQRFVYLTQPHRQQLTECR